VGLSEEQLNAKPGHHKLLLTRQRTANPRLSLPAERELDFHEGNPTFAHNFLTSQKVIKETALPDWILRPARGYRAAENTL